MQIKAWYMLDDKNIIKGKPVSQLPNGPSPGGVDWTNGLLKEQVPQAIRVVNNLNWAKYQKFEIVHFILLQIWVGLKLIIKLIRLYIQVWLIFLSNKLKLDHELLE